jgi:thiamine-phosphate pyrophosphorylase
VLLTAALSRVPLLEAARLALRGGADIIQLREKEAKDREILSLARDLREMTHDAGALFIVNDRPDIARLAGADGVHLGQTDLPPAAARAILGPDGIIGVSTHSVEQARQAVADGADYIGVGPMFPTATKGYSEGVGPSYIREAASVAGLPLVAIGGITPERVPEILRMAPERHVIIAVSSAILQAPDIEAAAGCFKTVIMNALHSDEEDPSA